MQCPVPLPGTDSSTLPTSRSGPEARTAPQQQGHPAAESPPDSLRGCCGVRGSDGAGRGAGGRVRVRQGPQRG